MSLQWTKEEVSAWDRDYEERFRRQQANRRYLDYDSDQQENSQHHRKAEYVPQGPSLPGRVVGIGLMFLLIYGTVAVYLWVRA